MSTINTVRIEKFVYPLKKPYILSFITLSEFSSLQVTIVLKNGEQRRAEVVPLFGYSNEKEDYIWDFLHSMRTQVVGTTLNEARSYLVQFISRSPFSVSPYLTGIDLFTLQSDLSVTLPEADQFIVAGSLQEIASLRDLIQKETTRAIKIKLTGDISYDIDALHSLKKVLINREDVRLDANQAYSRCDAQQLCDYLTENRLWGHIKYLEQPCPRNKWVDTEKLLKNCPDAVIMLDESIVESNDVKMASEIGIKFLKLKLFKQGGIKELIELSRCANRLGIKVILGNGVATRLSNSVEIQVYNRYRKFFEAGCEANGFLKINLQA